MHKLLKREKKRPREEGLLHYSSGPESPSPQAQLLAVTPTAVSHYVYNKRLLQPYWQPVSRAPTHASHCLSHYLKQAAAEPVGARMLARQPTYLPLTFPPQVLLTGLWP